MKDNKKRRALVVHARFQLSQAGVALLANLLVVLLVAALVSWFYLMVLDNCLVASHNQTFPLLLALLALVVVLFTTWWSLRTSRRIAGQFRKLADTLEGAARGEVPDSAVAFRKDDHFPQLAGPLDDCLRRMRQERAELNTARQVISEARGLIEAGGVDPQALARALDRFEHQSRPEGGADPSRRQPE